MFTHDPLLECGSIYMSASTVLNPLYPPLSPNPTTNTHFTIKSSPTTQVNTVTFITTSDFRIHEYMINLTEKLNKQNARKKSAYDQCNLNRIDLNSNNPPRFPTAAEFACIGLHLFEGVRACSALFTVKRMKMNSQIVLHL